jgi:glycosyltransferase involved in cell wall biosynthesis
MMLFSVVIPLYNKANHISATLNSIINQSFTDFEIIIVNDGSTDDSLDIANSFSDERINIYSTENNGVSYARNFGIEKAKTDYIVFIDADDIWKPHHLEDLKILQENFPDCGMYAKAYIRKDKKFEIPCIYKDIPNTKNWTGILDDYFNNSMINSIALTSAVMIPKRVFDSIGNFNETYNSGEDIDLWVRIALQFPVAFYNKVSVVHSLDADNKITKSSISTRQLNDFDAFKANETSNPSLKRYLDLNRYALAMQFKFKNNTKKSQAYLKNIDRNNLSKFQKLSLQLPTFLLRVLIKFRNLLRQFNIDLRLFK